MAYEIQYSSLNGNTPLPDRDFIQTNVTGGACPGDQIQIGLQLGPDITWWKGVQLDGLILAEREKTHVPNFSQIPTSTFEAGELHLWKGKGFQVHSDMYAVVDALLHMQGGNRYVFQWNIDNYDSTAIITTT